MLLRETDLLPTFRAGLTTNPDALRTYYHQPEKKVYTRENVAALTPVMANGQRQVAGKEETVSLGFEGRFEEVAYQKTVPHPEQRRQSPSTGT